MSNDVESNLQNEVLSLTRGDLDGEGVRFPFPDLRGSFDRLPGVRITRLARFWSPSDESRANPLELAVQDLVTGLHAQGSRWMFMLRGTERQIECWWGAECGRAILIPQLRGVFPDLRVQEVDTLDSKLLAGLGHAARLTGTPNIPVDRDAVGADRIERLCRALYGSAWAYLVVAEPVARPDSLVAANLCAARIRMVHALHLIKGSPLADQNRLARQVVELLEAKYQRLELGRLEGAWALGAWLLTASASSLSLGRAVLGGAFSGGRSFPDPVRVCDCSRSETRGPRVEWLTSSEAAILACPPREEYPGYELGDSSRLSVIAPPAGSNGSAITLGEIRDRGAGTGNTLQVSLGDLTKHGLIAGVTGSGKTNTCFHVLQQLAERNIPFLIIESAKSEYRRMTASRSFLGLCVFTCGDETTSPLRLNPFEVPPGIMVQTHIDFLKSLFSAAFVLYPPMPYVLEQALQAVYTDRGWDLARNTNARGSRSHRRFPILSDLVTKVRQVVDRMGYDTRITMDVKAGLVARLDQLRSGGGKGPMLNTRRSVSADLLFGGRCLIELKQLVDDDEKAFLIGLLLVRLYEDYEGGQAAARAARRPDTQAGGLRHVTLIEEAHRLLRNVSTEQGSEVAANPKGRAIEVFANILSEIRAYGEGILIAEQVPVKLVPDALKNTNLKIIHRLLAADDRQAVAGTMNLGQNETTAFSLLSTGEAVAFTEGMRRPVFIDVPLSPAKGNGRDVTNAELRESDGNTRFWRENSTLQRLHAGCRHCTAAVPGAACSGRGAEDVNAGIRRAFASLFNALRLNPAQAPAAYGAFAEQCGRGVIPGQTKHSPYCVFVELFEAEIEERGRFLGWSYDIVEPLVDDTCAMIGRIAAADGLGGDPTLVPDLAELGLRMQAMSRLSAGAALPFPGCTSCQSPCQYRFDMQTPTALASRGRFDHELFERADARIEDLARVCFDTSVDLFAPGSIAERREAGICFAAQHLHRLGMTADRQQILSRGIAASLPRRDSINQ